ncbi:hypothetical protein L1987_08850 [Smallanthus sonchifolius]|uniref:Uncharacterized protein n=1 Tax=Smallanthus sonchifolius TaxID=185202 RepID=A0ACB9JMB8_9ASTR|nr:hypothetical protein L1987_08850 [Smallanthus sonchifolius]
MIVVCAKKYLQNTGKDKLQSGKKVGFDKAKLRCYNYQQLVHFARECPKEKKKKVEGNGVKLIELIDEDDKSKKAPTALMSKQLGFMKEAVSESDVPESALKANDKGKSATSDSEDISESYTNMFLIAENDKLKKVNKETKQNEVTYTRKLKALLKDNMTFKEYLDKKDVLIEDLTEKLIDAQSDLVKEMVLISKWATNTGHFGGEIVIVNCTIDSDCSDSDCMFEVSSTSTFFDKVVHTARDYVPIHKAQFVVEDILLDDHGNPLIKEYDLSHEQPKKNDYIAPENHILMSDQESKTFVTIIIKAPTKIQT